MPRGNRYAVQVRRTATGWDALIVDPSGVEVARRACATEEEARVYASTVQQHLRWLSPERFRAYYRIPEPG